MDHSIKYQKFADNTVIIGPILSIDYITKTAKLLYQLKKYNLEQKLLASSKNRHQ